MGLACSRFICLFNFLSARLTQFSPLRCVWAWLTGSVSAFSGGLTFSDFIFIKGKTVSNKTNYTLKIKIIFFIRCDYPKELKMRVGEKRTKPLSIEVLCDWAKSAQPKPMAFQKRRVYTRRL